MKAVLIMLSGDTEKALDAIISRYPSATVETVSRDFLDAGNIFESLKQIRSKKPDVFAVMTESIKWLSGKDALMLFGAMAGAGESVIFDANGCVICGKRSKLLLASPFQIAVSYWRGLVGTRKTKEVLSRLESEAALDQSPQFSGDGSDIRVAYLRATPGPGTQPGGAASHINGVVDNLTAIGASVTFISNDEIAGQDTKGMIFHKIEPRSDIIPRTASDICNGMTFSEKAASIISSNPPSFVYQRYARFSYAGVEAALRARVPLFLEYNGSEVWIGRNWDGTSNLHLLERFERLNLAAAARIFVVSQIEKDNLVAAGVLPGKIVVNPNGVDTGEFRPGIGGAKARSDLKIADSTMLVGFVGTFGPWHGVLALTDAIALTPKNEDIHFLLVGDGSLRNEVEQRLRGSGDLGRVTFTGVVSHERVPILLDACDILVSPHVPPADGSEFFGSPTKLFEYMAMGKGIVASRLGQIGDVLTHDETALLVEPGNPLELKDAMLKLANDRALLSRLGNAARDAAVEKHTWRRNAEMVLGAFMHGEF